MRWQDGIVRYRCRHMKHVPRLAPLRCALRGTELEAKVLSPLVEQPVVEREIDGCRNIAVPASQNHAGP